MDKRLILAVAGSGKTTYIIKRLSIKSKALIVTYTEANVSNLKSITIAKFGYIPEGIQIMSYFSFALSFCYMPLFRLKNNTRGIVFPDKVPLIKGVKQTDLRYYQSTSGYLYGPRLAKLLCDPRVVKEVKERIQTYFEYFIVDEVQDFASHDFDLLLHLALTNVNILYVGDFYQHTYASSHDGSKRNGLFKNEYQKYLLEWGKCEGLIIDKTTLNKSYRCNSDICTFVDEHLGINMDTHKASTNKVVDLSGNSELTQKIVSDNRIKKLFIKQFYEFECNSANMGESKGLEFEQVCIVLSKDIYNQLMAKNPMSISSQTRSKLYVAFTRSYDKTYIARSDDPSVLQIRTKQTLPKQ